MNLQKQLLLLLLPIFFHTLLFSQNSKTTFPHKFYLEDQILIKETSSILEICNLQIGASYQVYMYDEREPSKKICSYAYGCKKLGEGFVNIIATEECMMLRIERSNCKFESTILVNLIMHCMDCKNMDVNRDPDQDPTCDLMLDENDDYQYLVNDLLLASTCFIVDDSSISGRGVIGEFWQGQYSLGMDNGVVLCNAPLSSFQTAEGGNLFTSTGTNLGLAGDIALTQVLEYPTYDAAVLEFDFYPSANSVKFEYVFASEEYCEWVDSPFNDGFALLLSGPGIRGSDYGQASLQLNALNLAVLPDIMGNIDYTTQVSMKTIHWDDHLYGHAGQIGNYYVSNNFLCNDCGDLNPVDLTGGHNSIGTCAAAEILQSPLPSVPPSAPNECAFDAWTVVMTAQFDNLIPCEKYHIKMVLADGSDRIWGSAVFLNASSFSAGGAKTEYSISFINDEKYVYEDCGTQEATLTIQRFDNKETASLPIEYQIELGGTATLDEDYTVNFEETIIIPPLEAPGIVTYSLEVLADEVYEGIETIELGINNSCDCEAENMVLEIIDVPEISISGIENIALCEPSELFIQPMVSGGFPAVSIEAIEALYSYSWTGPDGFQSDELDLTVLPSDTSGTFTYLLEVADDCGQVANHSFDVEIYPKVTGVVLATADSDLLVEINSGTSPYTFSWSNGETGEILPDPIPNVIYTVTVTDANDCEIFLFGQLLTSLFESELDSKIDLFPNPSSDFINFSIEQIPNLSALEISLIDVNGQVVANPSVPNKYIDLTYLNPGVYFAKFDFGDSIIIKKVIRN